MTGRFSMASQDSSSLSPPCPPSALETEESYSDSLENGEPQKKKAKFDESAPKHSTSITYDVELKRSPDLISIRETLRDAAKRLSERTPSEQLKEVPCYPTYYELARFASAAYENSNDEVKLDLPLGWKVLVKAWNNISYNGYLGVAYYHPENLQVVIAHRGTILTNVRHLYTDIVGIYLNMDVPQIGSACTFAHDICQALEDVNKDLGVYWFLFFTGHSLGGWLAQITSFAVRYLEPQAVESRRDFFRRIDMSEGYFAHTVVYESPGCKEFMRTISQNIERRFSKSGKRISLESLNITTIFLSPNIVNQCNTHLGTAYRLLRKKDKVGWFVPLVKNIGMTFVHHYFTHRIKSVLNHFDRSTGKPLRLEEVVDWPTEKSEYYKFYEFADKYDHLDADDLKKIDCMEEYDSRGIRYLTKDYEEGAISNNVFSVEERNFLKSYQFIGKLPDSLFDENITRYIDDRLKKCRIDGIYFSTRDKSIAEVLRLVPFVKTLLRLWPHLESAMRKALRNSKRLPLINESDRFVHDINQWLDVFEERVLTTKEFRDHIPYTPRKVFHLEVQDETHITAAKVRSIWKSNLKKSPLKNIYLLKLENILHLNKIVKFKDILAEGHNNTLVVLDCGFESNTRDTRDLVRDILELIDVDTSKLSFVFITKRDSVMKENIQEDIPCIPCKAISWRELNFKCQNELFGKELVVFQGMQVSLSKILAGTSSSNFTDARDFNPYIKILDMAVSSLLNDTLLRIGLELPDLGNIENYYIDRVLNRAIEVNREIFFDSSLTDLIVVSGDNKVDLMELGVTEDGIKMWNEELNDCKIILVKPETDTQLFEQLCDSTSKRNKHLLKVENKLECFKSNIDDSTGEISQSVINVLLNNSGDNLIVVSGANKMKLIELGVPDEDIKIWTEDHEERRVIILSAENEDQQTNFFDVLCKNNSNRKIHWLKMEIKVYWYKSVGFLNLVRKYVTSNTSNDTLLNIDDERFMKYPELIISDIAGMGKSTFLTRLAQEIKQQDPSRWVIGINLNKCTENLRTEYNKRESNVEGKRSFATSNSLLGVDFLLNEMMNFNEHTKLKPELERSVLRHLIMKGKGVTLLFDGYDEICPDYEKIVLDLLKSLKETRIQSIIVATRPYSKEKLENKLRTFSYSLVPFKDDDIVTFFVQFWKQDPLVNKPDHELVLIAEALNDKIKKLIKDEFSEFMGIPLQCSLMAEVLKDQLDDLDSIKRMSISLVDLYESFVEKKFKIYEENKIGDARGDVTLENLKKDLVKQVVGHHSTLALGAVLDKATCTKLKISDLSDEEHLTIHIQKAGLCQIVNKEARFIHKTFAEYLVSKYFVTELKTLTREEAVIEVLLARICLHGEFQVLRAFLDSHVTKVERTEMVLQTYGTLLVNVFTKHRDQFFDLDDQTMLHVLVKEDRPNMLQFILECLVHVSVQNVEVLETLLTVRDARCETALYMAAKSKKNYLVELFLKCLECVSEEVKQKLLLASCFRHPSDKNNQIIKDLLENCKTHPSFETPAVATRRVLTLPDRFLKASKIGDENELTKILSKVTDKVTTCYLMQCCRKPKGADKSFKTALNFAAENNHYSCVRILLENGALINFTNCFIRPPLYSAVSVRNTQMVNYLVENGADVNVKYRGVPVLHEAVQSNFQVMVECLLKLSGVPGKEGGDTAEVKGLGFVNATDVHGNTALHVAAKQGHEGVAQTLMVGAYVDLENVEGETPLHVALQNRKFNFALSLLRFLYQGKCTNVRNEAKYRPLHVAAQYGNSEVLKLVLDNNPSCIDHCDDQGNTPLHIASEHEQEQVVKILLENGAKVEKHNATDESPLDIAKRKGNKKIINVLNENKKLQ